MNSPTRRDWTRERGLVRALIGAVTLIVVAPAHNSRDWLTVGLCLIVLADGLLTMRRSS